VKRESGVSHGQVSGAVKGSTKAAIYEAALQAFAEKGYFGASLRDIAQRVGVEVASLYNHISSKESLLFEIIMQVSYDLLRELEEARDSIEGDELEVLKAVVRRHLTFSATHARHNFVGTVELRALTPGHYEAAVGVRGKVEEIYKQLVRECVAAGRLPADAPVTVIAYQLIALSTSVTDWFKEGGVLTAESVADSTVEFLERGLALRH